MANAFKPKTGELTIDQGTSFNLVLKAKSGGVLINTTGWTAACQFRVAYGAKSAVMTLTTENGRITNDGAGTFTLIFNPSHTATIKAANLNGVYDVEFKAPDNSVVRVLSGAYTINPEVTNV